MTVPPGLLKKGEKAEILEFRGKGGKGHCHRKTQSHWFEGGKGLASHLEDMGLYVGKVIEVLSNNGTGPMLLKVDETRIGIGRGISMKILVNKVH